MSPSCGGHPLVGAVGTAVALAGVAAVVKYAKSRTQYRIHLCDSNQSVQHVLKWFQEKGIFDVLKSIEVTLDDAQEEEGNTELVRKVLPAPGVANFVIDGKRVTVKRMTHRSAYGNVSNTLELSVDYRHKDFLDNIIEEARVNAQKRPEDKVTVFKADPCGYWNAFGAPRRTRKLDSVVLAEGVGESLLKDLKDFLDSKEWYTERSVPYRRGYLLYGPPGCGKSSIVKALASELGFAVSILNLTHKQMTDESLIELMCVVPNKSIVLLEDVDVLFGSKKSIDKSKADDQDSNESDDDNDNDGETRESRTANTVSFSGLLNTIDGIAAADGRILFMTTNHIERLDKALIRPGRVDRRQLITYPSEYQLKRLFSIFYKDADPSLAVEFANVYKAANLEKSIAEIQGHFLLFKNDPRKAIELIAVNYDPSDYCLSGFN